MGMESDEEVPIDENLSYTNFTWKFMTDNEKAMVALEKKIPQSKKGPIKRFFFAISVIPEETNVAKTYLT
jgi:hypothetical protein